jgi:hypothetical protein
MIVKIQRPLFSSNECPTVLIYNKDRTVEYQTPYNNEWETWFGDKLKRYTKAYLHKGILVIKQPVQDKSW